MQKSEIIKQNFVLEKLSKAGIEVVTDKAEFDRILERENILQKMAGTLSEEEQRRYFTLDEEDTNNFKKQIDNWQNNNINIAKLVTVGKIPPIMKVLGIADNPIEIQYSTLNKIVRDDPMYPYDEQGHKLTVNDIYAIPSQLADPVMVFKSRTRNDSFVFFTERRDINNRSILIPLAVNKQKGRIVINEITSMYGRNNEIDFVKKNLDENNLIYSDKKRSLDWERSSQVQFLTQRFSDPSFEFSILTKDRLVNFISSENPKIQKMVSTKYEGYEERKAFVTDSHGFVDPEKIAAIDLYGFKKAKEIWKDGEPDWETRKILQQKSMSDFLNSKQPDIYNYKIGETIYGFTYENKIYLNPDVMNSEAAVHEYTHLWDNYTQKTNPELWNKGLNIFKGTSLWNEVINDTNYSDIKNDENLVLSECHSRICGKIADNVLQKIIERDGNLKKADMVDWDKEVMDYIYNSLHVSVNHKMDKDGSLSYMDLKGFLSQPMKDFLLDRISI